MSDIREKMIDNMTENLPVLRKKLKLTQEGLAKIIGSSRYSVMQIEAKKRKMTWNTFLSLLFVFSQNKETNSLLEIFGIYSPEMKKIYSDINS